MLEAARRGAGAAAALGDGAERSLLRDQLLALAAHLSRTAREIAPTDARRAAGLACAFEETLAAIERVEVSNAAPALTLADLSLKIGRVAPS